MKRKILLVSLTGLLTLAGCGPKPGCGMPDFIKNDPKSSKGIFYGSGIAEKQSFQLAKDIADTRACREVAKKLGERVQLLTKDFLEESGKADKTHMSELLEFSQVVGKNLVDMNLVGCNIERREVCENDGVVQIFSLARLDAAQTQDAVHKAFEANKNKSAAADANEELERNVSNKMMEQ